MSAYYDEVRAFTESVGRLRDLSGGDFVPNYQQSEAMRQQCERARKQLEQHVSEHRCGGVVRVHGDPRLLIA